MFLGVLLAAPLAGRPAVGQMGHILDAVGPVNQSIGGAGTALPLDSMGALHWNPASITGLPKSEVAFGCAGFAPVTKIASSVGAGAFRPGAPPVSMQGSTTSDTDINPMASLGFVCHPEDSRWTYGLGGFCIGGFGVDYPGSTTNPVLTAQPPGGFGFGAIFSQFQMMQFCPTAAYQLSDCFSIGLAPTFNWSSLAVDPFSGAAPDDANGDTYPTYPSGSHADSRWGLGFQVGLYFEAPRSGWHLGVSYKSTQWFGEYKINSRDELGGTRQLAFDLDFPAVFSMGAAYTGFHRWDLAVDVRYINYADTDGFEPARFAPTGAVTGFGWNSIWAVSVGAQYHVCRHVKLRAGYTFNENPIGDDVTFFNVHAPGIIQHHLSGGFSWELPADWTFSLAYHHGFQNTISGPWHGPGGAIPGTSVTSTLSTHSMTGGVAKRF